MANCRDFLSADDKPLYTKAENENAAFMEIAVMCRATDLLLKSKSAKETFLSELQFDQQLPNVLPVEVAMVISESESMAIANNSDFKTWSHVNKIIEFEKVGDFLSVYSSLIFNP